MPRHPPCALKNLTTKMLASTVQFSNNKPKTTHTRQHQHPSPPRRGSRTGIPTCAARPKHTNTHTHPSPPTRHPPTRGQPDQHRQTNAGLVVSGPNSVPTSRFTPELHVPTQSPPPTPKGRQQGGAVLANTPALHNPKSQRPPMSTTHRTSVCESGV